MLRRQGLANREKLSLECKLLSPYPYPCSVRPTFVKREPRDTALARVNNVSCDPLLPL